MHQYTDLIELFDGLFAQSLNTRLVRGADEPIYLPADDQVPYNRVIFAHGYYASALHEIAHWCIAGEERRKLVDYGYWYEPDGRSTEQQAAFEKVEAKPQALEWLLAKAAGFKFNISVDNLNGAPVDRKPFADAVLREIEAWLQRGLPPRAALLQQALARFYQQPENPTIADFSLDELI